MAFFYETDDDRYIQALRHQQDQTLGRLDPDAQRELCFARNEIRSLSRELDQVRAALSAAWRKLPSCPPHELTDAERKAVTECKKLIQHLKNKKATFETEWNDLHDRVTALWGGISWTYDMLETVYDQYPDGPPRKKIVRIKAVIPRRTGRVNSPKGHLTLVWINPEKSAVKGKLDKAVG